MYAKMNNNRMNKLIFSYTTEWVMRCVFRFCTFCWNTFVVTHFCVDFFKFLFNYTAFINSLANLESITTEIYIRILLWASMNNNRTNKLIFSYHIWMSYAQCIWILHIRVSFVLSFVLCFSVLTKISTHTRARMVKSQFNLKITQNCLTIKIIKRKMALLE